MTPTDVFTSSYHTAISINLEDKSQRFTHKSSFNQTKQIKDFKQVHVKFDEVGNIILGFD